MLTGDDNILSISSQCKESESYVSLCLSSIFDIGVLFFGDRVYPYSKKYALRDSQNPGKTVFI